MDQDASFGHWLTLRRKALRLSRVELAQRVGCAVVTLRKIEADERRPSLQIAERLVEHLALLPTEWTAFLGAARGQRAVAHLPPPNVLPAAQPTRMPDQLPFATTPLIGRTREIAAIREQLTIPTTRLLTLLGAPGIGKTRLAIAIAHELHHVFADGVTFISLAALSTADLVMPTIARSLGIVEHSGQSVMAQLQQTLQNTRMLLILDNFEHVLDAAPALASLLTGTQHLEILVTSRVALRLSSEQRFAVQPLSVPPHHFRKKQTSPDSSWQSLTDYEAVALFVQRAQAVFPGFAIHETNAWIVAEICRRLDGLPLAIELAAARSTVLTPPETLAQLDQRLTLLSSGAVDLPMRQRTLRHAIAWSYELLDRDAQTLFRRLAVFVGGWTIAAAQAVCDADALGINIVDTMATLLDTSLIVHAAHVDDHARFGMLETIRAFAGEMLAEVDDPAQIQQRHLEYYRALAEQANKWGRQQYHTQTRLHNVLSRLRQEQSNLRAAFDYAIAWDTTTDRGLRLVSALEWFWFTEGYHGEGYQWASTVLANMPTVWTRAQHAQALSIVGSMAWQQGNYRAARGPIEESAAIYRELDDTPHLIHVLNMLGRVLCFHNEQGRACTILEETIALAKEVGDIGSLAGAFQGRAYAAEWQADYATARGYNEQCLAVAQAHNLQFWLPQALNDLGDIARCEGNYEQAAILYQDSLTRFQAGGRAIEIAAILHNLGYVALAQDDQRLSQHYFTESLALHQERNNMPGALESLTGFGALLAHQGQPRQAAVLFGAMLAQRAVVNAPMWPAEQVEFDRHFRKVADVLGNDTLRDALAEGSRLTLDEMTAYVLP